MATGSLPLRGISIGGSGAAYIDAHEAGWKNAKHEQQWRNTLEKYAYPVMGSTLVRDVDMAQVLRVLEPIWREKTETATDAGDVHRVGLYALVKSPRKR
jgi:hypothetical protein